MAVRKIEIVETRPFANGREFGDVGPYTQIDGIAHFSVDPDHLDNSRVADIQLAARDEDGNVHFAADFRILRPANSLRGNRRLLCEVPNRGHRLAMWLFDGASRHPPPTDPMDPGDGFLMCHGYTIAWCGWQHDVPEMDGLMRIRVPEALQDGKRISGPVLVTLLPTHATNTQRLADRLHRPYRTNDVHDPTAKLFVLDEGGEPQEIARHKWSFAKPDGQAIVPDDSHIYMADRFLPGKRYQVVYSTTGAPVVGLGMLATRDFGSFLRYGELGIASPCANAIDHAFAFGASQSGRYLRQWLYLGLNEDTHDRMVFDGVISHIAGGIGGNFNERFGQPSNTLGPSLGGLFPFSDVVQRDPATGRTDGLLKRLETRSRVPRIFFINSSSEYWRGDASLMHTSIDGMTDLTLSPSVRIYHVAGTQHPPGELPLTDTFVVGPTLTQRCQYSLNCVDHRPFLRASLVRMDEWVSASKDPPASRYPRIDDRTAVAPEQAVSVLRHIPGVRVPQPMPRVAFLDFGPEAPLGIASVLPPRRGHEYRIFVSALDRDGNEWAGIRLPDISVPLATYTGWNLRHPDIGSPDQIVQFMGATLPFPRAMAERKASGDPRLSVEERYKSKSHYLESVERAIQALVQERYLLHEDVERMLLNAASQYDLIR